MSDDITDRRLGVNDVRPFIAARDFERSHRFYEALGWTTIWAGDALALLQLGDHRIYLQDFYVRDWAENSVLVIMVEDPSAWHDRVASLIATGEFPGVRVTTPKVEAWGATVTHAWDPSGVLLQFTKLQET
ncbi:MAG: VOC family protein [Microthrixaceae bacterium]